jgi:hypothetical protein
VHGAGFVTERVTGRAALCAVLLYSGCAGSEHQIFDPLPPPRVSEVNPPNPAPVLDAGEPGEPEPSPMDSGPLGPPDAGFPPDEDLDENVTFVWTETLPGQGTCKAGRYAGSFTCTRADMLVISGQVIFTLVGSAEEQRLSVMEGAVRDLTGAVFNSGMEGELDCLKAEFDAVTINGRGFLGLGTFEATLTGAFDDQVLSITGDLHVVDQANVTCDGTFRVGASP